MNNPGVILFDLDGVLIDSEANMRISWEATRVAFDLNVEFIEYFSRIGRPFFDILELVGIQRDKVAIKKVYDLVSSSRDDLVTINGECLELISTLQGRGFKVGVVTSKTRERTDQILKRMPLVFDVIDCPEEGMLGKPNPDPLHRAMSSLEARALHTLYVGDMDVDYECSQAAGIAHVHVDWGYGEAPEDSICVTKPIDILRVIDDLGLDDQKKELP